MYNKLFTRILDSSIWLESDNVRIVWITIIAAMDEDSMAPFASIANLANRARVSVAKAAEAVKVLESPDKYQPDQEHEGRRIERVPGGWFVLNGPKYRDMVTKVVARENSRIRVAEWRKRKALNSTSSPPIECNGMLQNVTPSVAVTAAVSEAEGTKTLVETVAPAPKAPRLAGASPTAKLTDDEWLEGLTRDSTYQGIDVRREFGKMQNWCLANRRTASRRRFINWLNRAEKPMKGPNGQDLPNTGTYRKPTPSELRNATMCGDPKAKSAEIVAALAAQANRR